MSEEELIEVKPEFMGFHRGKYPGAFPPKVEEQIGKIIESPSLHLFSGSSKLGDIRVDLTHPNATNNVDVYEFIQQERRNFRFVVLDPDYSVTRKHLKLQGHARYDSVSGNVLTQRLLQDFLLGHADNVLWFDLCSPRPAGFYRYKVWTYLPGGYKSVRVLTWLKREGERLA